MKLVKFRIHAAIYVPDDFKLTPLHCTAESLEVRFATVPGELQEKVTVTSAAIDIKEDKKVRAKKAA